MVNNRDINIDQNNRDNHFGNNRAALVCRPNRPYTPSAPVRVSSFMKTFGSEQSLPYIEQCVTQRHRINTECHKLILLFLKNVLAILKYKYRSVRTSPRSNLSLCHFVHRRTQRQARIGLHAKGARVHYHLLDKPAYHAHALKVDSPANPLNAPTKANPKQQECKKG